MKQTVTQTKWAGNAYKNTETFQLFLKRTKEYMTGMDRIPVIYVYHIPVMTKKIQ